MIVAWLFSNPPQARPVRARRAPPGPGVVRGRVFNTVTGEYLRNAEVSVDGTPITVYSDDDGSFRLNGVPAGEVTLVVRYAGWRPRAGWRA